MEAQVQELLDKLLEEVDEILWASYQAAVAGSFKGLKTRLVFPTCINKHEQKAIRVSEQEARFVFANRLEASPFFFSPEKPTSFKYRQKGAGRRSAETDVGLYSEEGNPVVNCEFKAKGIRVGSKKVFEIRKDLEKLLTEDVDGVWFHTLQSVNCSTITDLCSVFCQEIPAILTATRASGQPLNKKTILFHVCVLKHQFALQKALVLDPATVSEESLRQFFKIVCEVNRKGALKNVAGDDWKVIRNRVAQVRSILLSTH